MMNAIDKNFEVFVSNIKIQSLEEVYQTIKNNYSKISANIQNSLEDFLNKFLYWGILKRDEGNYESLYNRAISLKEHIDDYIWLYDKLGDYRSKKLLFAILSNWYNFDFDTVNGSIEKNFSHYFDLDIVKCDENEVFVDVGAYIGDTVIDYLNNYGVNNYKKIYCYEVTDDSYNILKNNMNNYPNIEIRKRAVLDKTSQVYVSKSNVDDSANKISNDGDIAINSVSIDEDIDEDITMIKMDIEGAESLAIIGCKKQIMKNTSYLKIQHLR